MAETGIHIQNSAFGDFVKGVDEWVFGPKASKEAREKIVDKIIKKPRVPNKSELPITPPRKVPWYVRYPVGAVVYPAQTALPNFGRAASYEVGMEPHNSRDEGRTFIPVSTQRFTLAWGTELSGLTRDIGLPRDMLSAFTTEYQYAFYDEGNLGYDRALNFKLHTLMVKKNLLGRVFPAPKDSSLYQKSNRGLVAAAVDRGYDTARALIYTPSLIDDAADKYLGPFSVFVTPFAKAAGAILRAPDYFVGANLWYRPVFQQKRCDVNLYNYSILSTGDFGVDTYWGVEGSDTRVTISGEKNRGNLEFFGGLYNAYTRHSGTVRLDVPVNPADWGVEFANNGLFYLKASAQNVNIKEKPIRFSSVETDPATGLSRTAENETSAPAVGLNFSEVEAGLRIDLDGIPGKIWFGADVSIRGKNVLRGDIKRSYYISALGMFEIRHERVENPIPYFLLYNGPAERQQTTTLNMNLPFLSGKRGDLGYRTRLQLGHQSTKQVRGEKKNDFWFGGVTLAFGRVSENNKTIEKVPDVLGDNVYAPAFNDNEKVRADLRGKFNLALDAACKIISTAVSAAETSKDIDLGPSESSQSKKSLKDMFRQDRTAAFDAFLDDYMKLFDSDPESEAAKAKLKNIDKFNGNLNVDANAFVRDEVKKVFNAEFSKKLNSVYDKAIREPAIRGKEVRLNNLKDKAKNDFQKSLSEFEGLANISFAAAKAEDASVNSGETKVKIAEIRKFIDELEAKFQSLVDAVKKASEVENYIASMKDIFNTDFDGEMKKALEILRDSNREIKFGTDKRAKYNGYIKDFEKMVKDKGPQATETNTLETNIASFTWGLVPEAKVIAQLVKDFKFAADFAAAKNLAVPAAKTREFSAHLDKFQEIANTSDVFTNAGDGTYELKLKKAKDKVIEIRKFAASIIGDALEKKEFETAVTLAGEKIAVAEKAKYKKDRKANFDKLSKDIAKIVEDNNVDSEKVGSKIKEIRDFLTGMVSGRLQTEFDAALSAALNKFASDFSTEKSGFEHEKKAEFSKLLPKFKEIAEIKYIDSTEAGAEADEIRRFIAGLGKAANEKAADARYADLIKRFESKLNEVNMTTLASMPAEPKDRFNKNAKDKFYGVENPELVGLLGTYKTLALAKQIDSAEAQSLLTKINNFVGRLSDDAKDLKNRLDAADDRNRQIGILIGSLGSEMVDAVLLLTHVPTRQKDAFKEEIIREFFKAIEKSESPGLLAVSLGDISGKFEGILKDLRNISQKQLDSLEQFIYNLKYKAGEKQRAAK